MRQVIEAVRLAANGDTSLSVELAASMLEEVHRMGTTVAAAAPLNPSPLVIDEINLVGSRCGPFREAIAALADQSIDVASLIHRRMRLDQGLEAMDLAKRPGVLKVILTME